MSIKDWFIGSESESKKQESKRLYDVVENFQPTMRAVGCYAVTMDPTEGRETARIHGQDTPMSVED
ncbi:hypothetical protein [Marinobacter sp. OP 3.4]|uniref:hypothetical protein n=1 Tax=Marinobacter sp. OP 3.4 TaxID=3076501 RepID=UPI002E1EC371